MSILFLTFMKLKILKKKFQLVVKIQNWQKKFK
jgi:hypothetical protein